MSQSRSNPTILVNGNAASSNPAAATLVLQGEPGTDSSVSLSYRSAASGSTAFTGSYSSGSLTPYSSRAGSLFSSRTGSLQSSRTGSRSQTPDRAAFFHFHDDDDDDHITRHLRAGAALLGPASHHQTRPFCYVDLNHLTENQLCTLKNMSDHHTTFLPNQALGVRYHLPANLGVITIDPNNRQPQDNDALLHLFVNRQAEVTGQFTPGHHYISFTQDSSHTYQVKIITFKSTYHVIQLDMLRCNEHDLANLQLLIEDHSKTKSHLFEKGIVLPVINKQTGQVTHIKPLQTVVIRDLDLHRNSPQDRETLSLLLKNFPDVQCQNGSAYNIYDAESNSVTHIICHETIDLHIKHINLTAKFDEQKDIIFKLLNQHPDLQVFLPDLTYLLYDTDTNQFQCIRLSNPVVRYQEKKETHRTPDRKAGYAILGEKQGSGYQGTVYKVEHTIRLHCDHVELKIKGKRRIAKACKNIAIDVNYNTKIDTSQHEYAMMSQAPDIFHAKPPVKEINSDCNIVISAFFNGNDLRKILFGPESYPVENFTSFTNAQKINLCIKIAERLKELHAKNLIHRDLKPANIIVAVDPLSHDIIDAHIIDLGLASIAKDSLGGVAPGSPAYASPEAWGYQPILTPADVFTLGRICWEIISGHPIEDFLQSNQDAIDANLPEKQRLLSSFSDQKIQDKLYELLKNMNEHDPDKRIKLDNVIAELIDIAKLLPNQSSLSTTSAAAAATTSSVTSTGLFRANSESNTLSCPPFQQMGIK